MRMPVMAALLLLVPAMIQGALCVTHVIAMKVFHYLTGFVTLASPSPE